MKIKIFALALFMVLAGCSATKSGGSVADDYGYSENNPIKVGGVADGPAMERKFLNSLAGPNGETVTYKRVGSCCAFETPNSAWGGMLDMYEVTIEGGDTKVLYLNMYDKGKLSAPKGFTFK